MRDGERLAAVDGLRAIAMTMVIAQHCSLLPFGWTGVWLFYLISGYVIARGWNDGEHYGRFMWRRVLRIVPAYFAYLVLNGVILWTRADAAPLRDVPSLLGFWFNWQMIFADGGAWHPFGHLWTLSVEQQFYLVFPLLMIWVPGRLQQRVMLTLVLAGPVLRWWWSQAVPWPDAGQRAFGVYAASFCHADAFLMGALLARGGTPLQHRLLRWSWTAPAAAVLYLAIYTGINRELGATGIDTVRNLLSGVLAGQGREVFAYIVVDLLAAAVLLQALRGGGLARRLAVPWLAHVGRVSYGGYLIHALVLWFVSGWVGGIKGLPLVPRVMVFMGSWGATVLLASMSHRWFELPVARWGRAISWPSLNRRTA